MARPTRQDKRGLGVLIGIGTIIVLGIVFARMPRVYHVPEPVVDSGQPAVDSAPDQSVGQAQPIEINSAEEAKLHQRFQQAVMMLHAGRFDYAVTALHEVLALAPRLPEAHVNMGFALIGLENYKGAMDFFNTAVDLNPQQANAYYGMAVALDAAGDRGAAISAMSLYLHLANPTDPYVRKAQAALWEWDARQAQATAEPPAMNPSGQPVGDSVRE